MSTRVDKDGDIVIVGIIGKVDALTATSIQDSLDEVCKDEPAHLVIDLEEVPYISSAGLRVFIRVAKSVKRFGKLAVCNMNESIRQVFVMAGFDKIMVVCDDLDSAKTSV